MIWHFASALALIGLGVVGSAHAAEPIDIGMPMALTGTLPPSIVMPSKAPGWRPSC